jgi:hypothetical protein
MGRNSKIFAGIPYRTKASPYGNGRTVMRFSLFQSVLIPPPDRDSGVEGMGNES